MTESEEQGNPSQDKYDAAVIEQSWQHPEAFTEIFDRHAPRIHRYAARRLGPGEAADVVGDTFLAAFDRRRHFDVSQRDAGPWLYGIASKVVGRYRRQEVRGYRALARTGVDPVVDSPAERVEDRLAAEGASQELAAGLARLRAGDRDVILLIAWADLSYDQVAHALQIPVGTVRSRLNRARRKLREALGGADPRATAEETSHGRA